MDTRLIHEVRVRSYSAWGPLTLNKPEWDSKQSTDIFFCSTNAVEKNIVGRVFQASLRYSGRITYTQLTGLQGLYSATNCADNILGRFTRILQNRIARVDSFTNLTKRWVFRFRLNASISSHNLISFGKQFNARGPYTANARLPKVSCFDIRTFRTRSLLDLMEYILLVDGVIISWM